MCFITAYYSLHFLGMFSPDLRLQKPLEEFIECFERLSPRSLSLLCGMFAPEAVFEDPYHRAQGSEQIERMLTERLKYYPKCRIQDFSWGRRQGQAFMMWSVHGMEGISAVSLMPDGMIMSVNEFWGAHDAPRAYKRFTP